MSCLLAFTSSGRELLVPGGASVSATPLLLSDSSMSMSSPEKPKLNAMVEVGSRMDGVGGDVNEISLRGLPDRQGYQGLQRSNIDCFGGGLLTMKCRSSESLSGLFMIHTKNCSGPVA